MADVSDSVIISDHKFLQCCTQVFCATNIFMMSHLTNSIVIAVYQASEQFEFPPLNACTHCCINKTIIIFTSSGLLSHQSQVLIAIATPF